MIPRPVLKLFAILAVAAAAVSYGLVCLIRRQGDANRLSQLETLTALVGRSVEYYYWRNNSLPADFSDIRELFELQSKTYLTADPAVVINFAFIKNGNDDDLLITFRTGVREVRTRYLLDLYPSSYWRPFYLLDGSLAKDEINLSHALALCIYQQSVDTGSIPVSMKGLHDSPLLHKWRKAGAPGSLSFYVSDGVIHIKGKASVYRYSVDGPGIDRGPSMFWKKDSLRDRRS